MCGIRVGATFTFLVTCLVALTRILMAWEPWSAISTMAIPNAFAPAHGLPGNFSFLEKGPDNLTLTMPQPIWPIAAKASVGEDGEERVAYWASLMGFLFMATITMGTAIVVVPNRFANGQHQELDRVVGTRLMPTSCILAVISYMLLVTKVVLSSTWSGRLSSKSSLDFEGFSILGLWLLAWMVVQAIALRLLRPTAKFSMGAFATTALATVIPFLADPCDSAKDAIFAGIAMQSSNPISQNIGKLSLGWLWALHLCMLCHGGLRHELQNAYLGVLSIIPQTSTAEGPAVEEQALLEQGDAAPGEEAQVPRCLFILKKLFSQVTPERRMAIGIEDLPQGFFAVFYLIVEKTLNMLVLAPNVIVPLLRWIAAYFTYPLLLQQEGILEWLASDMLIAAREGADSKVSICRGHLATAMNTVEGMKRVGQVLVRAATGLKLPPQAGVVAMFAQDKFGQMIQGDGTELSLHDLGEAAGVALAESLKENSTLKELWLTGNGLGEAAGVALAEALKENSALTKLVLGDNNLGEAGGVALAEALKENSTLQQLDLYANGLGEAGGVALAESLKENSTLKELWLGNNDLGEAAGVALAEALKANSALTHLYLDNTNLGEAAGRALLDALQTNTTLQVIELHGNNELSQATAFAIYERVEANKKAKRTATSAGEAS